METHPQPPRSLGKVPATDTEGTLTVTNPEANPDTHVCADGGLPGPRAARAGRAPVEIKWWNFLGRSTEEIRQYREEWQNHGERFGHVEGYVGHGGPGKNREGMDRIPAPELPPIRMRSRKNPPPHARFRD